MKKILVVVFAVALLIISTAIAFAYDGISSGTVTAVRHRGGNVTLVIQSGATNPGGCSSGTQYLQLNEDGSDLAKRINSDIAIAVVTGNVIMFEITGCSGGGTTGWPVITGSWLKDQ